ncbi:alpha/beta fold hydrolase [Egicoccus sp. AB-alg2]|uniref:alpha/beta fold hydrolase n=1 Tax=Egicoccus sp. AB-alg2 TaxID=3242693 RepID=UPI00359DDD79
MTVRLVLVHGATSGPWVFDRWSDWLTDVEVVAPDLQDGLHVAHAGMADYTGRVVAAAGDARHVLCGWSMGGLVAMLAAATTSPAALVVIEPSLPAELGRRDATVEPTPGVYEAESAYGPVPPGVRHRPESLLALGERQRGVSVPSIDVPLLVVAGRDFADTRGRPVVDRYGGELLRFPHLDHRALVGDVEVVTAIGDWVRRAVPA